MHAQQVLQFIARLREAWEAMDADDIPLDSETRWSWALMVDQVHMLTGCNDNRVANTFEAELKQIGCVFQRDRMGKIITHAKREKVINVKATARISQLGNK